MPVFCTLLSVLVLLFASTFALGQEDGAEPPLPQPRPDDLAAPAPDAAKDDGAAQGTADTQRRVYQAACPALLTGRVFGQIVPPLSEGTCGLQSPIEVTGLRINGREIALSGAPITNCAMATTLADWAEEIDTYTNAALDARIESLSTGPGYVCRRRNDTGSGFVSEHGLGNAVDITAINLDDGTSLSVLEDWSNAPVLDAAKALGFAHAAACGRFTTVLGPAANADHEDHFHFDLGCHGQSCTAQICQ